jgi:hypothetical protein
MRILYFGRTWAEQWSLSNPTKTHNYLEMAYTIDDMIKNKQAFEVTQLRTAPFFPNYYTFQ